MSAVVLATAGYDHKIRFWEASREKCTRVIKYPDSQVNMLAITNDKQHIAAVGNPHAKIFDVHRGEGLPVRSYDAHQVRTRHSEEDYLGQCSYVYAYHILEGRAYFGASAHVTVSVSMYIQFLSMLINLTALCFDAMVRVRATSLPWAFSATRSGCSPGATTKPSKFGTCARHGGSASTCARRGSPAWPCTRTKRS